MRYGNLCIAAHNYKNDTFFSNISKLETNDKIKITDNFGITLEYETYDIKKANQNDLSCINQATNSLREITLITCDSSNDNFRIIVKAREKTNGKQ